LNVGHNLIGKQDNDKLAMFKLCEGTKVSKNDPNRNIIKECVAAVDTTHVGWECTLTVKCVHGYHTYFVLSQKTLNASSVYNSQETTNSIETRNSNDESINDVMDAVNSCK